MRRLAALLCCMLTWLAFATPVLAKPRSKAVSQPSSSLKILPAAEADRRLSAPLLSGLDYSAVAPPGQLLRVIEDEPYAYAIGDPRRAAGRADEGLSAIRLVSLLQEEGRYEARILLRTALPSRAEQLLASFDSAAHSAYLRAATLNEQRELDRYLLHEVRSPLGLVAGRSSQRPAEREYLVYTAEIANPLTPEAIANLATPYRSVTGQLCAAWPLPDRGAAMLCIEFTAADYAHSLTMTENIARCVLNRFGAASRNSSPLTYLAYYPEFELAGLNGLWSGQRIDSRTADLAERPGEGVGIDPQPIQGDRCPDFLGTGVAWPAQPYRDGEYLQQLVQPGSGSIPECSHCLLSGELGLEQRRELSRRREEQSRILRERQEADDRAAAQRPGRITQGSGPQHGEPVFSADLPGTCSCARSGCGCAVEQSESGPAGCGVLHTAPPGGIGSMRSCGPSPHCGNAARLAAESVCGKHAR